MLGRKQFLNYAIGVAALCVLCLGAAAFQRRSPRAIAASIGSRIADGDLRTFLGTERASIATVFVDLTCPHSRQLLLDIEKTEHARGNYVQLRYVPLNDEVARELALLGICTRQLSIGQSVGRLVAIGSLSTTRLDWVAVDSLFGRGPTMRLKECAAGRDAQSQLATDLRLAYQIGVVRSPSLIVGSYLIQGRPPAPVLRSLLKVDQALLR